MGTHWGLGVHLFFVTTFLVATKNTSLGAQIRNTTTVACFEHERLALLKFKHSVSDTYDMLSSWVGNDCCRWERVLCDGVTRNIESIHLRAGSFFVDHLSASRLRGDVDSHNLYSHRLVSNEVSTSLGELRHLKYLDLSGNDFQGSRIPEFFGSFKHLIYLNLSHAYFSGIIPHQIGKLSNLKYLDLSSNKVMVYNRLYQELMSYDMAWISGLSSLEHLNLSFVNLSGTKNLDMMLYIIPSLKELSLSECGLSNADLGPLYNSSTIVSNIKHLDLSRNSFNGQLPYFFQNLTSLQFLDLSSFNFSVAWNFANFLSKTPYLQVLYLSSCNLKETHLSHTLYNFTTLSTIQHVDLSHNLLRGRFPSILLNMTSLRVLNLFDNGLTGSIPESLGRLRLLEVLNLSRNKLMGPIPTLAVKLTKLYLSYNYLNGSIPESFGRLVALKDLFLDNNKLNGTIPVSIGQLTKLCNLDVSNNSLKGVLFEAHFANLSMLKDFNVASNSKLTFNVSREWLPPFQLISVNLGSCKIANGFPHWLRNQRKLKSLVLSNSNISGSLPTWLRTIPIIPFIDLSHNNLIGPLTNLPSGGTYSGGDYILRVLFLQNNLFNESIPRSLCKRTNLKYLDLSSNRLTGKIPKCLKHLQNLGFMRLSSNKLSGTIPSFIGHMSSLEVLNLNDNNFSGNLPREFWNLSELRILDLGDNVLCGRIPQRIGEKLKSLWVLRLHKNNFTGGIPPSLCTNSQLRILDIAHNNLRGTIPNCLGELFGMANNDVDSIELATCEETMIQVMKGVALEYTNTLPLVLNIDLSSNKLVGEIPVELTALSALVGLNLSNNHLGGGIPDNIGNMKALISLDFSGNELSGQIPPSIGALNFLSHLNLSNNNLSGRVPTGNQLQTLIDPSIYAGNKDLCGFPLPKNCSGHEDPITTAKNKYEADDELNKVWFYVDITCGFVTGFWGVIVVLVLKKEWRHKFFKFAERLWARYSLKSR